MPSCSQCETWKHCSSLLITLFIFDGPHHQVHTCRIGLATELKRALFPWQPPCIMEHPLQLRLAAAKLFQYKIVYLSNKSWLQGWGMWQKCEHLTAENTTKKEKFTQKLYSRTLYLSCSTVCPAAFWTRTHREGHWRLCNRGWLQG